MTATSAATASPRNALRIWASGRDIFVEIPNSAPLTGPPSTILKYAYGPQSLAKILALLGAQPYDFGGEPLLPAPPKNPIIHRILKSRGLIP